MDEFLKEVQEMSTDEILLAFEQPELYSAEELKVLKQELKKRTDDGQNAQMFTNEELEKKIANHSSTMKEPKDNSYSNIQDETSNVFWTKFLRTISMINLVCGIIIGLFLWYYIADTTYNGEIFGFVIGVIFVLLTMISTSAIMVFVEMSENVSRILDKVSKK